MKQAIHSTTITTARAGALGTEATNLRAHPEYLRMELQTFLDALPELLPKHEGKMALVHNGELTVFDTWEEAIETGYDRYGSHPFLVREISAEPTAEVTTRAICPQ